MSDIISFRRIRGRIVPIRSKGGSAGSNRTNKLIGAMGVSTGVAMGFAYSSSLDKNLKKRFEPLFKKSSFSQDKLGKLYKKAKTVGNIRATKFGIYTGVGAALLGVGAKKLGEAING